MIEGELEAFMNGDWSPVRAGEKATVPRSSRTSRSDARLALAPPDEPSSTLRWCPGSECRPSEPGGGGSRSGSGPPRGRSCVQSKRWHLGPPSQVGDSPLTFCRAGCASWARCLVLRVAVKAVAARCPP